MIIATVQLKTLIKVQDFWQFSYISIDLVGESGQIPAWDLVGDPTKNVTFLAGLWPGNPVGIWPGPRSPGGYPDYILMKNSTRAMMVKRF